MAVGRLGHSVLAVTIPLLSQGNTIPYGHSTPAPGAKAGLPLL